jgi:PAS domain S-box-containing protein
MNDQPPPLVLTNADLDAEVARLRQRLSEAEATLDALRAGAIDSLSTSRDDARDPTDADQLLAAIRAGEVDAFVVSEQHNDPKVLLLGAASRRYRQLVEEMHDGAVTLSATGDVLYTNPRFDQMLGMRHNALLGRRLADFLRAESRPLLAALLGGGRGSRSRVEVTLHRADGTAFDALLTPVHSADEHGISLLLRDLTEHQRLREAEEALRAINSGEVDAFVVERAQGGEIQMLSEAHRPYRLMVERMQQGAVTLSTHGEIVYTNQPFAHMLGHPIASLIGCRLEDLVTPQDRALLGALLDSRQGSASQSELSLLHESGGRVPVLVAIAMLPDEGGVCLIVTDLTAQKAYEAIVAAEALERSILDQAVDAIVLCDPLGRVARASRAAFELCTYNPLLQPFSQAFPLQGAAGAPDLAAVIAGATTLHGQEYTLQCRGQVDATVLLSAGPVVDADGTPRGCVVTMTDITERRQAEDRLRASDRHKEEFLAILAHELRNPLAPIRTAVEILRSSELLERSKLGFAVDIIGRQTANLIRLVDDLLDINRISQGKIVLQRATIDMRTVVDQALEICRPLISARRHTLETHIATESLAVDGDAVRLAQVVVNLITNAANYTPPGGRIEVRLERGEGSPPQAVVRVTDNGVGIPADLLEQIFEPYRQASQSKERTTGGLGLGLTVSRRLMQMHGGTVEARSAGPGRGAEFIARLTLIDRNPAIQEKAAGAATLEDTRRVLIVDDNPDAAESLAHLLKLAGHDVTSVTSGSAALECAGSALPDVVLLDIGMPGMDGYEVARRLRALPGSSGVRLIAMTGYGTLADRHESERCGIDHHLVKPVDLTALQPLLRSAG